MRVVIAVVVAVAVAGCNSEVVSHGARYSRDGNFLIATGREPLCGCMTMSNSRRDADRPLWLEATRYGQPTGSLLLEPGKPQRVQFDWGGPENEDLYVILAYDTVKAEGAAQYDRDVTKPPVPMRDNVDIAGADIETSCNTGLCSYGSLGMDRAFNALLGQNQVGRREVGVNVTKSGYAIEAVDAADKCGCMVLSNVSDRDVVLQSTLHGQERGRATLRAGTHQYIAYDAAGGRADDVYTITAVSMEQMMASNPTAVNAGMANQGAGELKVADFIKVTGKLGGLECDFDPAHPKNPNPGTFVPGAIFRLPGASQFPDNIEGLVTLDRETLDRLRTPAVLEQLRSAKVMERLTTITCPFSSGADGSLRLSVKLNGEDTPSPVSNALPNAPASGTRPAAAKNNAGGK